MIFYNKCDNVSTIVEGSLEFKRIRYKCQDGLKKNNLKRFYQENSILDKFIRNIIYINKEKQRGSPLLGANKYTHIYIKYTCVYI